MALLLNTDLALITANNSGTITLPLASSIPGRVITFKDVLGTFGTNRLTLNTTGGDTFEDGGVSKVLSESYGYIQLVASDSKWFILNGTQVNTIQVSAMTSINVSSFNISTASIGVSSLSFIDNRRSTNSLNVVSTFLTYNNFIISGTKVGYSGNLNRYTSNFINPTIVPGLVLWLDGADGDTLFTDNGITKATVGQSIFRWSDKSLSRNNAIQSGLVGFRPVLSTDSVSGKTVLRFTAASTQSLILTPTLLPIGTADATYFIVVKPTQPVVSTQYLYNLFSYGTAGEIGTGVTGRYRFFGSDTTGGSATGSISMAAVYSARTFQTITIGQTLLITGSFASYIQSLSANGGPNTTTNLFPTAIFNTGSTFASIGGNEVSGGGTGYLQGDIYEIIAYNYSLGLKDLQLIQGYLAWKWGAQANLPATHPYRSAPP